MSSTSGARSATNERTAPARHLARSRSAARGQQLVVRVLSVRFALMRRASQFVPGGLSRAQASSAASRRPGSVRVSPNCDVDGLVLEPEILSLWPPLSNKGPSLLTTAMRPTARDRDRPRLIARPNDLLQAATVRAKERPSLFTTPTATK